MALRLAFFDLDGTLKQARDPYVYLHRRLGTWEASRAFFEQGLAGEIDYDEWLRRDAALWAGVSRAALEAHLRDNPYLPGAADTVRALRAAGVQVAIVSTGPDVHAHLVQAELGVEYVAANEIVFEAGCCTGRAIARVPEGGKGHIVARLQAEAGVGPDDCLAVGDGASDAAMFARVRLGVAVNPASDVARAAAGLVLEAPDLRPLLELIEEVHPGWIPLSKNC